MTLNRNSLSCYFQNKTVIYFLTFLTCLFIWFGFSSNIIISILGWTFAFVAFKLLDTALSLSRKILRGDFFILKSHVTKVNDDSIETSNGEIVLNLVLGNDFKQGDDIFLIVINDIISAIYNCNKYNLDEDLETFIKN